jgi:glucan-binding YG repeat protein
MGLLKMKEKKENTRKAELTTKVTNGMNQEETAKATDDRKKLQAVLKDTMKKVALRKTAGEGTEGQGKEPVKIGKKIERADKKRKARNADESEEREERPRKATRGKRQATPQGERIIPKATDAYGCKHKGLLDLKVLQSDYLKIYMRKGGWLWNVPCKDCVKGGGNEDDDAPMLDLSNQMMKGKKDVGYYCNCGPTGHDMVEDHPYKRMYTCDLVLCMGCYDKRKGKMGRPSRRRK